MTPFTTPCAREDCAHYPALHGHRGCVGRLPGIRDATCRCDGYLEAEPEQGNPAHDAVDHPAHYTSHPSGVECIAITEHFGFNIGNAIKYLWRAGLKGDAIEDLQKAAWYVNREVLRLTASRRATECACREVEFNGRPTRLVSPACPEHGPSHPEHTGGEAP